MIVLRTSLAIQLTHKRRAQMKKPLRRISILYYSFKIFRLSDFLNAAGKFFITNRA